MSQTDVLVVDAQQLYRRGVVATLDEAEGIGRVAEAGSIADCLAGSALDEADVVVLDAGLDGAAGFVSELSGTTRVLVLADEGERDRLGPLIDAGAIAALERATLTAELLVLGVRAVTSGRGGRVWALPGIPSQQVEPRGPGLTEREQQVLVRVADGLPTREIALELCYSERTVKKVLGDVVMKLGARSRSQAIARAVRQGII